jgi:hypothetical protein
MKNPNYTTYATLPQTYEYYNPMIGHLIRYSGTRVSVERICELPPGPSMFDVGLERLSVARAVTAVSLLLQSLGKR